MNVMNAKKPLSVRQLLECITPECTPERKRLHVVNLGSSEGSYTLLDSTVEDPMSHGLASYFP